MEAFKVLNSLKVETTTYKTDLKGSVVFVDIEDDTYSSYLEVLKQNGRLPYLVDKSKFLSMVDKEQLVSVDEVYVKPLVFAIRGTPITHDNLISEGFTLRADMYIKNNTSVQLVKGHTWVVSNPIDKFNKDVKYIEDLV